MQELKETIEYIKNIINDFTPEVGVILGSGLGSFCDDLDGITIPYKDIPNLKSSTIEGHKGEFLFCKLPCHNGEKNCVVMQGRIHYYEGYTMQEITYPVRILKELGVKTLIITNAAGATSKSYNIGDIMMIEDHINLMSDNPLIGPNNGGGERFPSLKNAYSLHLQDLALNCACDINIDLIKGTYLATSGPSYETKAEVKAFKTLGADAIGMSTVPEVIVASYLKMDLIAFSLITNYATGVTHHEPNHQEVLEIGEKSGKKLAALIKRMIYKLD